MSTSQLLPPFFWFRVAVQAPYVERIVAPSGAIELPEACALPPFGQLDPESPPSWSRVRVGWNDGGLGLMIEVDGKTRTRSLGRSGATIDSRDLVDICIDTRDTRDVHRATRFCHRFHIKLAQGDPKGELAIELSQTPIPRALAEAPKVDIAQIVRHGEMAKKGWRLGLFIPSTCLHGFDPETNPRLGLMVHVSDYSRGPEAFGVQDAAFPLRDDPSLWATLELTGRA